MDWVNIMLRSSLDLIFGNIICPGASASPIVVGSTVSRRARSRPASLCGEAAAARPPRLEPSDAENRLAVTSRFPSPVPTFWSPCTGLRARRVWLARARGSRESAVPDLVLRKPVPVKRDTCDGDGSLSDRSELGIRVGRCAATPALNAALASSGMFDLCTHMQRKALWLRPLILAILLACAWSCLTANAAPDTLRSDPSWSELSALDQEALAPLMDEWNMLTAERKQRWLRLAERHRGLPPAKQERLQRRLRDWMQLTPEERNTVREHYRRWRQLPPEERQRLRQRWDQYRQLPADKRDE